MATSLLFKTSDQNSNHDDDDEQNMKMKPLCGSYEETKSTSEPGRSNRGRKANGKGPKKQPQRGLGVEKLERLRMQESLMKMNETCGVVPNFPDHLPMMPFTVQDNPFSSSSGTSLPMRYGGVGVEASNHVHGVVQCHQQVINGNTFSMWGHQGPNFIGNRSVGGRGGVGDCSGIFGGGFVPNQLNRAGSYGSGGTLWSPLLVGSPLESSKELPSMPNVHFEPQCFDICLKKSRFNEVNVKGSNARRGPFEIYPNDPDFLGLNPQLVAPNFVGETSDFYNKLARHAAANANANARTNLDEGVEVVAVHRRGNSVSGRVFMEYEFFPGKDGIGTSSKGMELSTNTGSVAVGGEASPINATPYGDTASNSIDLSLKLSH